MKAETSTKAADSYASLLGGVAIVGAAAGYAAMALKVRAIHRAGRPAASAEMRAANAAAKAWDDASAAREAGRRAADEYAQRAAHARLRAHTSSASHRLDWAISELRLPNPPGVAGATLEQVKAAFRARAVETHPDSGRVASEEAFLRVRSAHDGLVAHLTAAASSDTGRSEGRG